MKKNILLTVLLLLAWMYFATLFYKTIVVMLIALVWQKRIREKLPDCIKPYGIKAMWVCLVLVLWGAMPRYRIDCGDRVRMVYLDDEGHEEHAPLLDYIINTLVPEEEVVNFGIKNIQFVRPVLSMCGMHLGGSFITQASDDIDNGKMGNFFKPYDNLGLENPLSGVYPQFFNQMLGGNVRAVYICEPKGDENVEWSKDNGFKYPLVVFCHGYLGNWQLFQGIWKDLDNCIVLSIGTRNLSGIFTPSNLKEIFYFYIPALERMGYNIDREQLHLMGLSNGGSAIVSAMHSSYAKKFRSITTVSCNLEGLKRVPCQVNFIGGGKDKSSCRMPEQCRQLKAMGVDAGIFFKDDENHFIMVNKREEIIEFLKDRMQLKCVNDDDVPYKEHKDIVAITGLDDFPSYTYSHNEKHTDIWSGRKYVAIYFNFNKELSSEYIKKMKALCNDKDNVHWENEGDTCFIMTKVWDGKYIKAPVKDSKLGNRLELAIHKKGFEIYQGSAIDYRLEDFAEKDSLKKNTGVSFPKYRLVYYHCNVYRDTYEGDYLLLLDKKPSDAFIRNLEKSPKWKKCGNGIYECYYVAVSNHNGVYGAKIKVDKNCRVVKIKYGT